MDEQKTPINPETTDTPLTTAKSCIEKVEELRAEIQTKYPEVSDEVDEHLTAISEILSSVEGEDKEASADVEGMMNTKTDYMDELANS